VTQEIDIGPGWDRPSELGIADDPPLPIGVNDQNTRMINDETRLEPPKPGMDSESKRRWRLSEDRAPRRKLDSMYML
jgi:hypothetical protein